MRWEEILSSLESLSKSQGLYGGILRAIHEMNEDELDSFKEHMEAQSFKDTLELVLYIEEGA